MRQHSGGFLAVLAGLLFLTACTAGWAKTLDWQQLAQTYKSPKNLEEHLILGIAYANLGEIEKGARQFDIIGETDYHRFSREIIDKAKKRIARDPKDLLAHNYLAFAYYARKEYPLAKRSFQEVVKLDPDNVWSHNYLAVAYAQTGEVERAIKQLETSLKFDSRNQYTHLLLGLAYTQKKDYVRAALSFAKAPRAISEARRIFR